MIRIPDRDGMDEPESLHEETQGQPADRAGVPPRGVGEEVGQERIVERSAASEVPQAPATAESELATQDEAVMDEAVMDEAVMDEAGPGESTPEESVTDESPEELQAAAFQEIGAEELESQVSGKDAVEVPTFPKDLGVEDWTRLRRTVEALLFASTERLTPARLSEVVGVSVALVRESLEELQEELDNEQRPYMIREHGGGFRLYTRQEYYPFLLRLRSLKKVEKLTPAALETLAIVAYRQPVIRSEVEAIRGVKVGPMLRALLDRKLVKVVGRAEVPGAPLQYGTTQNFLDRFGLKGLSELPSLKEFKQGRI